MGYGGITAFLDTGYAKVTNLDLARRLIHHDLRKAGIVVPQEADVFIAKLLDQVEERARAEQSKSEAT